MKTLYLFITAIIGIFVGVLLVFLVNLIIYRIRAKIHLHDKKNCNFCEASYVDNHSIYCPECGEPLTFHQSDELFKDEFRGRIIHFLKIREEYYQAISQNKKRFELRKNDRNFHVGDLIIFKRICFNNDQYLDLCDDPLIIYKIDYVLTNVPMYGLSLDYCILSISKAFKSQSTTNKDFLEVTYNE